MAVNKGSSGTEIQDKKKKQTPLNYMQAIQGAQKKQRVQVLGETAIQ